MAGYQDERGKNYELKYLRKVLGEVDEKIAVPDSVRGDALRCKLNNVYPTVPAAPNKKSGIRFGLHWFSLQSGISYAAAFALIVGLFYGLGFNRQPEMSLVERNMALSEPEAPSQEGDAPAEQATPFLAPNETVIDPAVSGDASVAPPAPPSQPDSTTHGGSHAEPGGVGGGGASFPLGTQGGYTYTWRSNDATDPDKGGFPITIDIVQDGSAAIAAQIDIPDMQGITECYLTNSTLSVIGNGAEGIVTRSYLISTPGSPEELGVVAQPGSYISSRIYQDVIHTVTFCEEAELITCESEVLPYSITQNACIITALDTATGGTSQKAFIGADNDIDQYNLSIFISYMGEAEAAEPEAGAAEIPEGTEASQEEADKEPREAGEAGDVVALRKLHIAQVRLDKTEITLSTVS